AQRVRALTHHIAGLDQTAQIGAAIGRESPMRSCRLCSDSPLLILLSFAESRSCSQSSSGLTSDVLSIGCMPDAATAAAMSPRSVTTSFSISAPPEEGPHHVFFVARRAPRRRLLPT